VVDWGQALAWRLKRQFLGQQRGTSAEEVVGRLGSVPAWLGDAEYAVSLRLGVPPSDVVDAAFTAGRLLKVYSFRGSMQFTVPEQARVHLAIRAASRQWELKSWREHYRLQPDDWPGLREKVRSALAAGPLTQAELADAVARGRFSHLRAAFLDTSHTLIKPLGWLGDLSFAPSRDGHPTFQALAGREDWPGVPDLDEAGHRAVLSYLDAYGPATPDRLHYWLGEGLSGGRQRITRWIDELGDLLARVDIEGERALIASDHLEALEASSRSDSQHLLSGYDQWVMGPGTSDAQIVPPAHRAEVSRGVGIVVTGGRVTGTWRPTTDGPSITPFGAA
jgi:hypothetical protein